MRLSGICELPHKKSNFVNQYLRQNLLAGFLWGGLVIRPPDMAMMNCFHLYLAVREPSRTTATARIRIGEGIVNEAIRSKGGWNS